MCPWRLDSPPVNPWLGPNWIAPQFLLGFQPILNLSSVFVATLDLQLVSSSCDYCFRRFCVFDHRNLPGQASVPIKVKNGSVEHVETFVRAVNNGLFFSVSYRNRKQWVCWAQEPSPMAGAAEGV